jgi:uncharacterized membrane protein
MSGDSGSGADDEPRRTDGGRAPEALTDLDGIGPARADKLRDAGFETVADVRGASQDQLADVLGSDLAGRVKGQLDAGTAEGAVEEATDDGPSVPSSADDGGADGGPSVPSNSADETASDGPSVPSGTGGQDAGGTDTGGQDADDIGWETGETSDQPTTGGGEAEATVESSSQPTTGTGETDQAVETTVTKENKTDNKSLLAAIVSFFIPGVGNMINGQTERGLIILILWVVWLVVGWGIGVFIIGGIVGVFTLGIGFLLIGLVVGLIDFLIHILAAVDAYQGSKVVDNVTVKIDQVRGN